LSPALSLVLLLVGEACPAAAPPRDANAFVRDLVGGQRRGEEALSRHAYDVTEVRERLDGKGRARRREIREYEVFYVRGRPVRRLVARDNRELTGRDREREDRRVRQLVEAIQEGRAASEMPGVRLSRILERYDFTARGAEEQEGRCSLVFDFAARPGDFDLERDNLLSRLSGRLWVDEEEHAVARLEARNTAGLRFAFGLGASVSTLSFDMSFTYVEDGVWLPLRLETYAEGRRFLFRRFRSRRTSTYSNYRRFEVGIQETLHPEGRSRLPR
jgi:hypothetical protein